MVLCQHVKMGYKECFTRFLLDNKRELVNKRVGKKYNFWSVEDKKRIYDEVKKGTPSNEIINMFPNRSENAVSRFITKAREKYGIKKRKQYPAKKVDKFDLDGNYIETYNSAYEASKKNGVLQYKITSCCRGARDNADGFVWRYTRNEEGQLTRTDYEIIKNNMEKLGVKFV